MWNVWERNREGAVTLKCKKNDWPGKVSGDAKWYVQFKNPLSIENNVIMLGYRVVISQNLRQNITILKI